MSVEAGQPHQVLAQASGVTLLDVTVADRLPTGLSFVSATSGGTYNSGNRTITWLLSTLDPGASLTLSYTVTVDASGDWTNAACAGGADASGTVVNDCANTTVTGGQPTPVPTNTPAPTSTPPPTSTPTATPTPTSTPTAPVEVGGAVVSRTNTPTPTPSPGPTRTPTPGAPATPTAPPVATATPTSAIPPTPGPRPTLTAPEIEVEGEVEDIVQEREEGIAPQIPVQLPSP